ncbi:MAG: GNAT family N-acetyltransferase [Candidatus Binataceae bacterium]|nr:GNAT family N-acetyltransferase [Candidatus Binataceae bacterium]
MLNYLDCDSVASRNEVPELRVLPFEMAREVWQRLVDSSPAAGLHHDQRWLTLLSRTYRLPIWIAALEHDGTTSAACVFARSGRPFAKRFVSLPFSDSCPPLTRSQQAGDDLLEAISFDPRFRAGCEIRGIDPGPPWDTAECFAEWMLDLNRPLKTVERGYHENFRRNMRRAAGFGVKIEHGRDRQYIERFFAMQLETRRRHGIPPQPFRLFTNMLDIFDDNALEIWIASHNKRDISAAILLRFRDRLYYRWGARRADSPHGINQLLFGTIIQEFAGKVAALDLGRTDVRNQGLTRFKRELGASAKPLPYAFLPKAPQNVSAEVMSGSRKLASQIWSHLPLAATRMIGAAVYGYLA